MSALIHLLLQSVIIIGISITGYFAGWDGFERLFHHTMDIGSLITFFGICHIVGVFVCLNWSVFNTGASLVCGILCIVLGTPLMTRGLFSALTLTGIAAFVLAWLCAFHPKVQGVLGLLAIACFLVGKCGEGTTLDRPTEKPELTQDQIGNHPDAHWNLGLKVNGKYGDEEVWVQVTGTTAQLRETEARLKERFDIWDITEVLLSVPRDYALQIGAWDYVESREKEERYDRSM
ncbi:MAG: hypothetical protein K8T26_19730 [Lentisphaerae bacterium]|nr:hypothetical protein [Lentisphaerota bacterium]